METTYAVTPVPPKPLPEEILELSGKTIVNLEALYAGQDPFDSDLPF